MRNTIIALFAVVCMTVLSGCGASWGTDAFYGTAKNAVQLGKIAVDVSGKEVGADAKAAYQEAVLYDKVRTAVKAGAMEKNATTPSAKTE